MDKQEFKKSIEDILDKLELKIDELKQKIASVTDDAKVEYADQIEKLKSLKDELSEKLKQFDLVSESKWEVVKESAVSFFTKVSAAWKEDFGKVRKAFREEGKEE